MSPETGLAFPIGPFILRTQVEHLVCISAPLYNGSHLGPSRTGGGRKGRVERTRGNSVPKEVILKMQANKGFTCALGHLSNRINTVKETVPD